MFEKIKNKLDDFSYVAVERYPFLPYLRTFLTYFSLMATIAFATKSSVLWVIGIISGLAVSLRFAWFMLTSIVEFCAFIGGKISAAIGAFCGAFTLVPFLSTILAFVLSFVFKPFGYVFGGIFGFGLFFVLSCAFPFGYALTEYYKMHERPENKKLEFLIIVVAVVLAIALPIASYSIQKIGDKIEAPVIQAELNRQELYDEYIIQNPEKINDEYFIEIHKPTTSDYDIDAKVQVDTYVFEKTINNVVYEYQVSIRYFYENENWRLTGITETKTTKSYVIDVNGTYKGTGKYIGNMWGQNEYTFVFEELNEKGGSGNFRLYFHDEIDETINFTVQVIDKLATKDNITLQLKFILEEPLVYKDFVGSVTEINELEMTYDLMTDTFETYSFSFNALTLISE